MAAGTKRMVQRNVIVRKLNALEALGGVTDVSYFCAPRLRKSHPVC